MCLQHNANYVLSGSAALFYLHYQPHVFHFSAVLRAGGDDIDARGIDAAVAEDIRKLCDVLFQSVKRPREQVAQIVRKYFVGIDVGVLAHGFHLTPDIRAADGLARPRNKNRSCCDLPIFGVAQQLFLQLPYKEHRAGLALAAHRRLPRLRRLHGDELQLAHANTRTADRLKDQIQTVVFVLLRGVQQPDILGLGQLLFFAAKDLPLAFDRFHFAVVPAEKGEQAAQRREHGVDARRGVAGIEQRLLERHGKLFCDRAPLQKRSERPHVTDVFFDGVQAFFARDEMLFKLFNMVVG